MDLDGGSYGYMIICYLQTNFRVKVVLERLKIKCLLHGFQVGVKDYMEEHNTSILTGCEFLGIVD